MKKKVVAAAVILLLIVIFFCLPRHINMDSDVSEKITIEFIETFLDFEEEEYSPTSDSYQIDTVVDSYTINVDNNQYITMKKILTHTNIYPRIKGIFSRKLQEAGGDWIVRIYFDQNQIYIFSNGNVSYSLIGEDDWKLFHLGFDKVKKAEIIRKAIYDTAQASNVQD